MVDVSLRAAKDVEALKGIPERTTKAHYVDITPQMKADVQQGQAMFMPAGSDAAYMRAAEKGDTKGAQLLVDQAAKAAGYTDFLYHGTSKEGQRSILFDGIDQMKSEKGYFGRGFYMAKDEGLAKSNYADFSGEGVDGGAVLKLAVEESANILDLSNPKDWETYRGTTYRGRPVADLISLDNYHEIMVSAGIDGVTDLGSFGGTVVYNPKVLKSADPITYDDAGNIIPLSERFQPSSDDIRFMPAGEGRAPRRMGSATSRPARTRIPMGAVAKQLRLERDLKELKRN